MQTLRDLAGEIVLIIIGLHLIAAYWYSDATLKWFWITIGTLDLLFSITSIIRYFRNKKKKK